MATDTRSRMLEATARLLRQRGYHGTSLNDILAASAAPRGSLYFHFPGGKDQLVIEVTRASVERITESLREKLSAEKRPALAVRRILEAIAAMLEETDFALGCPVAPVVLDATTDVPELVDLCRHAFEQWIGLLRATFADAGIPDERAHALAVLVESSFEGLLVIARACRDTAPIVAASRELEMLLDTAVKDAVKV